MEEAERVDWVGGEEHGGGVKSGGERCRDWS